MVLKIRHLNRLIENYRRFGVKLTFITDKSQEGFQFVKGFGGCGGFLRYNNNFLDDGPQGGKVEEGEFDPENDFI